MSSSSTSGTISYEAATASLRLAGEALQTQFLTAHDAVRESLAALLDVVSALQASHQLALAASQRALITERTELKAQLKRELMAELERDVPTLVERELESRTTMLQAELNDKIKDAVQFRLDEIKETQKDAALLAKSQLMRSSVKHVIGNGVILLLFMLLEGIPSNITTTAQLYVAVVATYQLNMLSTHVVTILSAWLNLSVPWVTTALGYVFAIIAVSYYAFNAAIERASTPPPSNTTGTTTSIAAATV